MSSTSTKKSSKIDLYESIADLPLWNWEKIVNGAVQYLIINEKDRNKKVNIIRMMNAYDKISDEYFKAMDLDLENEELFILTQKLIWKRQDYINGDKSAINFIKLYEDQIKAIKQREGKSDLVKNRMAVSKWYKQPIDPKTRTVLEFCKIIELMKEEISNKPQDGEGYEG